MKKLTTLFLLLAATAGAADVSTTSVYDYQTDAKPCERGGCFGELCGEPGANPLRMDCKPEAKYACMAYAECKRVAGGCMWKAYDQTVYDRCQKVAADGALDKIPSAVISDSVPNKVDYMIPVDQQR